MGSKTWSLEREHEIIRRLGGPFAKALRFLSAVEGAVYFDRGQLAAGIFEFARLRQPLGVELPAPRLEHPSADADPDHRSLHCSQRFILGSIHLNKAARSFAPCNLTSSSIRALVVASSLETTLARPAMGLRA